MVMALVDGPTGENDNMICVAYKHQFDLINESTGDAYRLHHVEANRVRYTCLNTHKPNRHPQRGMSTSNMTALWWLTAGRDGAIVLINWVP